MKKDAIHEILISLSNSKITVDQAFEQLKDLPFQDLGFAKLDHHRQIRKNIPEAILCAGKTIQQIVTIFEKMQEKTNILATKASPEVMQVIAEKFPQAEIHKESGIIFLGKYPEKLIGKVIVLTAGTSDIKIAEEAVLVLKSAGVNVESIYDVGVAGLHRLLNFKDTIKEADAIIAVAGMDGVLPTVVAGLFAVPVIAVPTSIGYGTNFSGVAPLLTMLNSCAPGVVVVNIDNGYGAGCFATMIVQRKGENLK